MLTNFRKVAAHQVSSQIEEGKSTTNLKHTTIKILIRMNENIFIELQCFQREDIF